MYSFPSFELVCCSMSSSNCCFLTFIQVSHEAGKVFWYFHLFKNFPVCYSHSQRLWHSQWSRSRCFSGILLLFLWSNSPVQFLSHVWLLQSHGLQHTRLPCPSSTPGTCLNSCPSSRWCHPTNSSSVALFSSCPQSFPASGSFPISQFFASGGQSIGASASVSVLPMNIQVNGCWQLDLWFLCLL